MSVPALVPAADRPLFRGYRFPPAVIVHVVWRYFRFHLGGCALQGGKGTLAGTMLAVFLIGTLSNGMSLLGIATFYQLVAKGLLLVLAVAIQQWRLARAERARTRLATPGAVVPIGPPS